MPQYQTVDKNGSPINFDTNAVGGNVAATTVQADSAGNKALLAPGALAWQVSSDGQKPTYRAGAVAQTLYSTAAAVLLEIQGSATKTVRIKKITIWAQAGTKFYSELTLLRCTAVSASGSPVVANLGKHDTADAAATAVINNYAAAALAGTGHAVIGAAVLAVSPPTAGLNPVPTVWDFSRNQDKAMVLRGIADVLQIFNNTTVLGTATFGWEAEWEEDAS